MNRIKKFIKENPDYCAYLLVCAAAGVVIGKQRGDIINLRKALIKEAKFANDLLSPMVTEGLAAKFDANRNKVVFFEMAMAPPRPLMDQYFGPR